MYVYALLTLLLAGVAYSANQWKFQVRYGHGIIFNCTEPNTPTGAVPIRWMLPNLTFVDVGVNATDANMRIINDGWQFQIKKVTAESNGLYHCITQYEHLDKRNASHTHWFMIKRGLNIDGPYFGDLAKLYRNNIIYGFVAMGSFLLFITVTVLVYTYRWQPQPQPVNISVYQLPGDQQFQNGKSNPVFLYDSGDIEKIPPKDVTQM